MDSPTTHEKIIEVLRPVAEAKFLFDGSIAGITREDRDAARDLYQRLQAEKEGGWQPIETAPNEGDVLIFGGRHERVEIALADGDYWRRGRKDGLKAIPTHWRHLPDPPLNQEGGDAPEAANQPAEQPVAPPASANAGTGRATDEEDYDPSDAGRAPKYSPRWYAELIVDNAEGGAQLEIKDKVLRESLVINAEKQVANAVQRGLAEGKRIGIEEAAKAVGEIADKLAQRPEWTVAEIVDLINEMPLRALTGDPQT